MSGRVPFCGLAPSSTPLLSPSGRDCTCLSPVDSFLVRRPSLPCLLFSGLFITMSLTRISSVASELSRWACINASNSLKDSEHPPPLPVIISRHRPYNYTGFIETCCSSYITIFQAHFFQVHPRWLYPAGNSTVMTLLVNDKLWSIVCSHSRLLRTVWTFNSSETNLLHTCNVHQPGTNQST